MTVLLVIAILVAFKNAKIAAQGTFFEDYLEKDNTTAVNGIFVIFVFLSHAAQYITLDGKYDEMYVIFQNHMNQMVVATFLFYSGYGMMESVQKKGYSYVESIFKVRIWKLLVQFNFALVLFLIVGKILGRTYDWKTILLSTIGWKNVGNSNWYIFAILILYILFFLSYLILKWNNERKMLYVGTVIFTVLSMLFVLWEIYMNQPMYCYDTAILFAIGCWWSLLKDKIYHIVTKNDNYYLFFLMTVVTAYCYFYNQRWKYGIEGFTLWSVSFIVMVLLLTMKMKIGNEVLRWFGSHVFSIYILQRIPMSILQYIGVSVRHKYMFVVVSLLATMWIAPIFEKCTNRMNQYLFSRRQKNV